MAIDVGRVVQAAIEAAAQGPSSDGEAKTPKPRLSAGRALLIGAGLVTVGRLAAPRGREMLGSLRQRLEEFESDSEDEEQQTDEKYDDEPEGDGDEDFDEEDDYDDEEPGDEVDDEFDEEDDYDDEEPGDEVDADFDEEPDEDERPRPRRRTRSRAPSRS